MKAQCRSVMSGPLPRAEAYPAAGRLLMPNPLPRGEGGPPLAHLRARAGRVRGHCRTIKMESPPSGPASRFDFLIFGWGAMRHSPRASADHWDSRKSADRFSRSAAFHCHLGATAAVWNFTPQHSHSWLWRCAATAKSTGKSACAT
jgi:hypothetical protein